jgi:deoxyadenosine/deoxycytidine kinase
MKPGAGNIMKFLAAPTKNKMVELKERLQKEAVTIGIIGPMGVGKSTLSQILAERLNIERVEEKFPENPFLEKFYADPVRWSFDCQFRFMLDKISQLKELDKTKSVILDPGLEMDFIYALTHQRMGWMKPEELDLYMSAASALKQFKIKEPDVILRIHAPIEVLRRRIAKRGRSFEKGLLEDPPVYLQALEASIEDFVAKDNSGKIINYDVSKDSYIEEVNVMGLETQIQRKLGS